MLLLAEIMINPTSCILSLFVRLCSVKARLVHHLVETRWVQNFISSHLILLLMLTWWVIKNLLYNLVKLKRIVFWCLFLRLFQ
jgi:hypothetical protein